MAARRLATAASVAIEDKSFVQEHLISPNPTSLYTPPVSLTGRMIGSRTTKHSSKSAAAVVVDKLVSPRSSSHSHHSPGRRSVIPELVDQEAIMAADEATSMSSQSPTASTSVASPPPPGSDALGSRPKRTGVRGATVTSKTEDPATTALVEEIYDDIIEDAVMGIVFEVHRSAKMGTFFITDVDPSTQAKFKLVDAPNMDIFGHSIINTGKDQFECTCPQCHRSLAACRFAPHLEKCMGMGRTSSRLASRRIAATNAAEKARVDEDDELDEDDDWMSTSKAKKASRKKLTPSRKPPPVKKSSSTAVSTSKPISAKIPSSNRKLAAPSGSSGTSCRTSPSSVASTSSGVPAGKHAGGSNANSTNSSGAASRSDSPGQPPPQLPNAFSQISSMLYKGGGSGRTMRLTSDRGLLMPVAGSEPCLSSMIASGAVVGGKIELDCFGGPCTQGYKVAATGAGPTHPAHNLGIDLPGLSGGSYQEGSFLKEPFSISDALGARTTRSGGRRSGANSIGASASNSPSSMRGPDSVNGVLAGDAKLGAPSASDSLEDIYTFVDSMDGY